MTLLDPPTLTIVTGASGWFGRAYLAALAKPAALHGPVARHGTVRVLVQRPEDVELVLHANSHVEVHVGDVADAHVLQRLFADSGGVSVVHAAGVIHPARISDFYRVNVDGTAAVIAAARRSGARRLVYLSSNSPFGANASTTDAFRAEEPYNPYLGYGSSKMRAELLVRQAHADGELETVVVRPPWFYGPWQPERQTRFLHLVRTGRFPMVGSGAQRRSMVQVDNLVQGVALAERTPGAAGGAFWVADERPYPLLEVVETVREALRQEGLDVSERLVRLPVAASVLAGYADGFLQRHGRYREELHVLGELGSTIACDISATEQALGYRPGIALLEGMRHAVRWCLDEGLTL